MNGFELHGIQHTSPSSINTFAAAPDVWVAQKLFGVKSVMGASAARGTVIEEAVVRVLAHGVSVDDAVAQAVGRFNKETALAPAEDADDERAMIAPCTEQAVQALAQYGKPTFKAIGMQDRIELLCNGDGWKLPVIGYLDLPFPEHGVIIDLKTTSRMPSVMSEAHQRQAAIYAQASGNMAVKFLYVTPKKSAFLECGDVANTLADVKMILNRQERFLRLGDKETLRDVVHFAPDSFYWRGNEMARKELFGR